MPVAKPAPKQMFGFSTSKPTNVYTPTPSKSPVVSQVVPRSTTTAPATSSPKIVGGYSASFQNAYNALNPNKPTPTPVARPAPAPAPTPAPAPKAERINLRFPRPDVPLDGVDDQSPEYGGKYHPS